MKLARRQWFDTVALCVGSMMPDLMYSFNSYVGIDTHSWPAALTYGIPLAVVTTMALRRIVSPVVPLVLPDAGPFRLRSFGVLATRQPSLGTTMLSVTLGIGSHVTLDWFTHPGRPGPRWFGYEDVSVTVFGLTAPLADVFQLIGHSVGSLVGVWLLLLIGRRRLLDDRYGSDRVRAARSMVGTTTDRWRFWGVVAAGLAAGFGWSVAGGAIETIQRTAVGGLFGCIAGGALVDPKPQVVRSRAR